MAKLYKNLENNMIEFIKEQKIFFVASAMKGENINLSPKGYESLAVIDESTVCYLDYPGSGNETARHSESDGRLTMMFCSFGKKPLILRLYGKSQSIRPEANSFKDLISMFKEDNMDIVRQIIVLKIESVMTSCGYGVPFFEFKGSRNQLRDWSIIKAKEGTLERFMGRDNKRPLED